MVVGLSSVPVFQNPDFFNGVGSTSSALTYEGTISADSLFDAGFLNKRDQYMQQKDAFMVAQNGREAAINTKIANILSYLENGKEDKAMTAYNELLNEMSTQRRYAQLTKDGDDTQLRAVARSLIEASSGLNLEEVIRENTREAKSVEYQQWRSWGNCDSTSQEELLKSMCDIDEDKGSANIIGCLFNGLASPLVVLYNKVANGGKKM